MKKLKFFFLVISISLLSGCYCKTCLKSSYDFELSEEAENNISNFIIEKTGKEFYDNYIFPDYINSKKVGENYELHFILTIPGKEYVKEPIVFTTDANGNVLEKYEIIGIPDCKDTPEDGTFNLSEKEVEELAIKYGMAKGIKPWKIDFMWSAEFAKYVWYVLSVKSEMHYEDNYKASGEEMIINPYDGKLIIHRNWDIR
jgi:hypothetical protein